MLFIMKIISFFKVNKFVNILIRLFLIIFVIFMLYNIYYYFINSNNLDSNNITLYATLIGTALGSVISWAGAVYVHSSQLKHQEDIKKRDLIYKPLYNKLYGNYLRLLSNDGDEQNICINNNDYWFDINFYILLEIKKDDRFIVMPDALKKRCEVIINDVNYFNKCFEEFKAFFANWVNIHAEALENKQYYLNCSEIIAKSVLSNNKERLISIIDLKKHHKNKNYDEAEISTELNKMADKIIMACQNCDEYVTLLKQRNLLIKDLKKINDCLELKIKLISTI